MRTSPVWLGRLVPHSLPLALAALLATASLALHVTYGDPLPATALDMGMYATVAIAAGAPRVGSVL